MIGASPAHARSTSFSHSAEWLQLQEVATWPAATSMLAGCSSFGMSGINAHGIFSAPHTAQNQEQAMTWARSRHWPIPVTYHMLVLALYERSTTTCRFQAALVSTPLAYLLDHIVQDTSILPGAGMLEIATASGRVLAPDVAGRLLCLREAVIPAPVVMTVAARVILDCHVNCGTGAVQLQSTSKLSAATQTHFKASASSLSEQVMDAADAASTHAAPGALASGSLLRSLSLPAPRYRSIQCTAEIQLDAQDTGCGWIGQPAMTDNALQLGPATGDVGKEDDADVTRVVAGMAAYLVSEQAPQHGKAWTAVERVPMAAGGTIYTSHWLFTPSGRRCGHVSNLQAKVINLDGARTEAAAAVAQDRQRVIYEVEWQARSWQAQPNAAAAASRLALAPPVMLLTGPRSTAQFEVGQLAPVV